MIQIVEHREGCVLAVRGQPGARRNGIQGEANGALKIAVTAPADKGKANQAMIDVLREFLGVKGGQIELLSGFANRHKRFLIRGWSKSELEARLANGLGPEAT